MSMEQFYLILHPNKDCYPKKQSSVLSEFQNTFDVCAELIL